MAEAKKEVADPKSANVVALSSMFEQDQDMGNENVGQEDLATPFLKIISGQDDDIMNENENAKKGDIYNTVSKEIFKGKDGIRVIPCSYQVRFIQWAPRGNGTGAPVAIYLPNEKRPETQRDENTNQDKVVGADGDYIEETHQHFVLLLKDDGAAEPALITMKSTQRKKSKKWNTLIKSIVLPSANGAFSPPRFSHIYKLTTVPEKNDKGSWHGWEMAKDSMVTDESVYNRAKAFAQSIKAGEVPVKHQADNDGNPEPVAEDTSKDKIGRAHV